MTDLLSGITSGENVEGVLSICLLFDILLLSTIYRVTSGLRLEILYISLGLFDLLALKKEP